LVTEDGTVTEGVLELRATTVLVAAGAVRVTVPVAEAPPTRMNGVGTTTRYFCVVESFAWLRSCWM